MSTGNLNLHKLHRSALLLDGLTLYQAITQDETVQAMQKILNELVNPMPNFRNILAGYHRFCNLAVTNCWPEHLLNLILQDVNPFSRQASITGMAGISENTRSLVARDLTILQQIACLSSSELRHFALQVLNNPNLEQPEQTGDEDVLAPINWPLWDSGTLPRISPALLPGESPGNAVTWLTTKRDQLKSTLLASKAWGQCLEQLAGYYQEVGCGLLANYVAFRWQVQPVGSKLIGIDKPDPMPLEQLIGLQAELKVILENTSHLLKSLPANNLILYGNRGTGKSSVIKSLLHTFAEAGLRLVELPKADLSDLTQLVQQLGEESQKFIVFIDDLSFDEGDADYKSLKTILEGTLAAKPANVLIYATSNRRHLIKEQHSDRQENELHLRDGLEEKLSLADRFGITITFLTPDQAEYLNIVEGLAKQRNLVIDSAELRQMAVRWELHHNGRSGRTARQFIDYLTATMSA